MIIFISPAKTFRTPKETSTQIPFFSDETKQLIDKLKPLSVKTLEHKMKISEKVAQTTYEYYQNFGKDSYPAIFTYFGHQYKNINPEHLVDENVEYMNQHLYIIDGLYGLLKPLDLISFYRLEMQDRTIKNLYRFWKPKIISYLNTHHPDDIYINLASNEYGQIIKHLNQTYTIEFYKLKYDQLYTHSMESKRLRGLMVRTLLSNQVNSIEEIYNIDLDGSTYSLEHSKNRNIIFIKEIYMQRLIRLILSRTTFILLLLLAQIAFFFVTINFLAQYQYVHTGLYIITVIIIAYLIYKEENPIYKLTWIIPIMIFPLFGGLFYLFYKNTNISKKAMRLYDAIEKDRISHVQNHHEISNDKISNYLYNIGWPAYQNTKTTFFDSGSTIFDDIKKEISVAKDYIYMQFFIINKGKLWDEILELLKTKSAEGIKVIFIYDDFGSSDLPYNYTKTLKAFGIDAYNFNPMKPHLNFQMNYRNHRKIVVIDGKIGYTGGINIGDEYINLIHPFGHWQDAGIKLEGEAVQALCNGFLDQLRFITKDEKQIGYTPKYKTNIASESIVIPFFDAPLDKEYTTKNIYMQMIHNATSSIDIATPYLILDYELLTALKFAVSSGVRVNIIIPYIPDKRIVYMVSESYAKDLANAGIQIYKFKPGFIHSKMMVVDKKEALIGTVNLDYRSLYLHFENSIYIKNDPSIMDMKDHFESLIKQSVNLNELKHPNLIYRFLQLMLKGFSSIL